MQGVIINMEGQSDRKQSIEDFAEQQMLIMFPRSLQPSSAAIQYLTEHYDAKNHRVEVAKRCFCCHIHAIVQAYDRVRDCHVVQPPISMFYANECFVSVREVSVWLLNPHQQYPSKLTPSSAKGLKQLLDRVYLENGFIPSLQRLLLDYPLYLQKQYLVEQHLFDGGKIDRTVAYFLAYCGAAQLGCVYVMARMLRNFIKAGGPISWVLQSAPPKFQPLLLLNRTLARCPWQINSDSFADIITKWRHSDVCFIVQIFTFAHQQSTIALAMGLIPDCPAQPQFRLHLLTQLKEDYGKRVSGFKVSVQELEEEERAKERKENKKKREVGEISHHRTFIGRELRLQSLYAEINKVCPVLPPFRIVQPRKYQQHPTLDFSDYNFKFMAYPTLHSLTPEVTDKIRDQFVYVDGMTAEDKLKQTIGEKETVYQPHLKKQLKPQIQIKLQLNKEIRKALRYYSENLCGYVHLEENYRSNVSDKLSIELKFFVRLLTLSPIHITKEVLQGVGNRFQAGHIAILIANTKIRLELTIFMNAFEL